MKTKVILLTAALAIGTGCKGNGDATKAVSPDQAGQYENDRYNRDHRQRNAFNFLDRSRELRQLVQTQGSDLRVINGRLRTSSGHQGSLYDLKLRLQDQYGGQFIVRQRGNLIPHSNFSAIDMYSVSGAGVAGVVGKLSVVIDLSTDSQCALLDVNVGGPAGLTRVMFCEESDDYDNDGFDRRDGRRRPR